MEPWLVPVISAVGGGAVALAARVIDRRRGVPREVDAAIDTHVEFVMQTLKDKVAVLEASKHDCEVRLQAQDRRVDELQAQVNRLLRRLGDPRG